MPANRIFLEPNKGRLNVRFTTQVSGPARLAAGFIFGLIFMAAVVSVFFVSSWDFENMRRGAQLLLSGVNPWAPATRITHFYNPPFAVLFLWPLLFISPKVLLVLGGACLFALMFYYKAWVASAWFATNTFLWLVAAGGIDMLVIGLGLILLLLSDQVPNRSVSTGLRVLGMGLLMVKPQGGIFIVLLYLLKRRDWISLLVCGVVYGLLFIPLYPDWLRVLLTDPPLAQTEASHSLNARFGLPLSLVVAGLVIFARRWKYWQLGGALAGILAPYGMPGVPIFLILTGVSTLKAIPAIILYSAVLATLTWVAPQTPLMGIYHLGMLGLALILACLQPGDRSDPIGADEVDFKAWAAAGLKALHLTKS